MNEPEFPKHILSSGSEIWDWAAKLSAYEQHIDKIRRLRVQLAECGRYCGACDKWMKSRECPKERNVNGYSRGPSMKDFKCNQFVESASAQKHRSSKPGWSQTPVYAPYEQLGDDLWVLWYSHSESCE
ncbi:hypothetical protein MPL3356_60527 [Mesorhizobium plurifarium]|uniref:Uncharacterized protein n=1 Tax=Mesorhizobium plurifarium TaxID=69974 RepID=A0A090E9X0_MESPL|nr:hypothetical protein MPL3356_60527 [Mesorhizobium plurifarium]